MKIDTVELGRTTWLRMRLMREFELLVGKHVWIWDQQGEFWRPPTLFLVTSF